jgi:hypothetical protein
MPQHVAAGTAEDVGRCSIPTRDSALTIQPNQNGRDRLQEEFGLGMRCGQVMFGEEAFVDPTGK